MRGLTFIRHAETDLAGTFCGHSDPPINARGHSQVGDLVERLTHGSFDVIYSSDLRRAVDTATPLARTLSVPCITSSALREIHFGSWEAMTWTEVQNKYADYASRWIESFPELPAPEGELFANFEHRVLSEIDRLLRLSVDKRIAVVTHGGVMRIVLQAFLGHTEQQAWELTKPHCSSFVFVGHGAPQEVRR